MNGELRVVDDVADTFTAIVRDANPATLALSGGTTAERCYRRLAREPGIDWTRVRALLGDERWVPVAHPDSNEGMARGALLEHVPVAQVHSMREAGDTREQAAQRYDALVGELGAIDLIHLGLGEDGHTASLFPGTDALAVRDRYVVGNAHPDHPWPRLTLTYPGIALGRLVVVTVSGAGKRDALAQVRAGADVPAAAIRADEIIWLADREAAQA